jgi:ribonucleotide reductase beta subunit family protein with ferritin-like domain
MGAVTRRSSMLDDSTLEERASPFRALYEHWETTQWAAHRLDLTTDTATFRSLDEPEQAGMVWIFAHRFHAEFGVARLLAPFLAAAPDYEMQLMLATQVADEYRHLQSVLRVYDEVFGVHGGIEAVQELADRNMDPVAEMLYDALDGRVLALQEDPAPETFSRAVFAYHCIAEGVVARTAQNLAAGQYERHGFPGLAAGQKLVARDEARHIGIGVSYVRRCAATDPTGTYEVVAEVVGHFAEVAAELLALAQGSMDDLVVAGYGTEPEAFYGEAMRLLQLRMRSIGFAA